MEYTKHHPADTLQDQLDFLEEFSRAWKLMVSPEAPNMRQLTRWYALHHPLRMLSALSRVSAKAGKMEDAKEVFTADHQVRLFSAIANHMKTEEEQEDNMDTLTTENTKTAETPGTAQPLKKTALGYIGMPKTQEPVVTDTKTGAIVPQREN